MAGDPQPSRGAVGPGGALGGGGRKAADPGPRPVQRSGPEAAGRPSPPEEPSSEVVGQDHLLGEAMDHSSADGRPGPIDITDPMGRPRLRQNHHRPACLPTKPILSSNRCRRCFPRRRRSAPGVRTRQANGALGGKGTLLFVDEIHRFNRAQQDGFLPYVEDGTVILIGATTENPSFELNPALLSRCQVFRSEQAWIRMPWISLIAAGGTRRREPRTAAR